MISLAEVLGLLALCAGVWLWLDSIKVREVGVGAARHACRQEGVQLLDDTVVFRSLRLARDGDGRLKLQRVYDFEYSSTGNNRFRGSVMLLGQEVGLLDVSEHRGRHLYSVN